MHVDTLNPDQPNNRLFSMTVGFSLLAHVVVIGLVHFTPPDPRTLFNRAPLEIVLVSHMDTVLREALVSLPLRSEAAYAEVGESEARRAAPGAEISSPTRLT